MSRDRLVPNEPGQQYFEPQQAVDSTGHRGESTEALQEPTHHHLPSIDPNNVEQPKKLTPEEVYELGLLEDDLDFMDDMLDFGTLDVD